MFDWDGTVADSSARIVACLRASLADLDGPTLSDVRLRQAIGLGLPETARFFVPDADEGFVRDFVVAYRDHWLANNVTGVDLFAGIAELFETLHGRGRRLAIATGKSRAGLDRELGQSGLRPFVAASRCADETASKPDPRMLHEILRETTTEPADAVVIGDTSFDLEMAEAAGVRSVAVSYGAHERRRLESLSPAAIVDDVAQLVTLLM